MWPYWFLFGTVAWLTLTRVPTPGVQPKSWPGWWRIIFVLLVAMIGLRHEVGGDWGQYVERIINVDFETLTGRGDPAYFLLNWVGAYSGMGVYFANTVCAVVFTYGLVVFCRVQPRPWLALLVAVPYFVIVVAMGYTRQSAAIGLVMLGLVALSDGKLARFVVYVAIAATFHKSAVILMPLAVVAGKRHHYLTAIWVGLSSLGSYVVILRDSVDSLNTSYMVAQYQSQGAAVRVAMNVVPAVIFLTFRRRFEMPEQDRKFWTWMSLGGLVFVVWLKLSPSSTAVDRVALYWIPLQLFVLSRLPDALGKAHSRATVLWIVVYSFAVQFVWLNFASHAMYWLPYQFFPWVALWR